jgi:hypothetical protein
MASEPINGRVWLGDALTSGAFAQPDDPEQTAAIDVHVLPLAALAAVVIRRLGSRPDMLLADLADRIGIPLTDIERAQRALDDVGRDVER